MKGVYSEQDSSGPSQQPAAVLAAWIQELLAELQQAQGKRLAHLRAKLQSEAFAWDASQLAQSIAALNSAGRELHFAQLRQGWLARMLGKHRPVQAQFVAAHERMIAGAAAVKTHHAALAASYKSHTANERRVLVELDIEWQALNAELDQGVTWLQDMCTQLADARAQGRDDPQIPALAEAAQAFTQEFKRLQAVSSMAHDIAVRGNNIIERRNALLEQVRAGMDLFDKAWLLKLGRLVADLKGGRSGTPGIPAAIEAHDELMKQLAATADACGALQHEEHLMAQQLGMLHQQLDNRSR